MGGIWNTTILALVFYFIRYLITGFTNSPYVVVACQLSHGVTATLMVAGGVLFLKGTSPLPVITTLLALFNSIHYGVGTIVGSSLGGIIYQQYNGRTLFLSGAILSIVWAVVLFLYVMIEKNKKSLFEEKQNPSAEDEKLMTDL